VHELATCAWGARAGDGFAQEIVMKSSLVIGVALLSSGVGCTTNPPSVTAATKWKFVTVDAPGGTTTVNGLNNNGDVVGFATSVAASGDVNANFVRHPNGTFAMINVDDAAGTANAVNAAGTIVGAANGNAFVQASAKTTMLMPFGAMESVAFGINDRGVIVGQYKAGDMTMPGFVDDNGKLTSIRPTAKSTETFVAAINAAGLATGFYSEDADGATQHGFTYDTATQKTALLADPSTARIAASPLVLTQFLSINDHDQLAGYYQTTDGSQYGFVYDLASHNYIFLDHPMAAPVKGVQITQITGINDSDELAGFYIDAGGTQHGFIATPM
jgi:hypothetical protein